MRVATFNVELRGTDYVVSWAEWNGPRMTLRTANPKTQREAIALVERLIRHDPPGKADAHRDRQSGRL